MVAAAVGSGPRYAPVDPTLPPPWRALVDGNTGYIYYWNTETNVTQYEKPIPAQAPPLPAGPPPVVAGSGVPKSAVTSAGNSSGPPDVQSGRSAEARGSANGNMPASAAVSTQGSGHGLSGGNLHAGGGGNSFPNSSIHDNSGGNVSANIYGNSNSDVPGHTGGHVSGGVPRSGPGMSGSGPRSGPGMVGSGPRSSPGMPGGTVHMNAGDNSYGSSGRHTHGGSAGPMRGGSIHTSSARNSYGGPSGNAPAQPKLAALPMPQRQQAVGGMHMPIQPRHMGHANASGPGPTVPSGTPHAAAYKRTPGDYTNSDSVPTAAPGSGHTAPYKRTASDYTNNDPDLHKKPRMQGFSDSPLALDVDAYRRQHEITVVGDNMPPPFMTFDAANFPPEISRELHTAGFAAPTPIQAQTWPIALQGRNIVAIAKTGSGKTLGYLVPAFLHLSRMRVNSQFGPSVLVLAPTRELATQIQDEAVKFGRSSRISCTCVYGGAPKGQQLRELDRGADIVIATPGRLNDFLEMKKVSLRQVSYLVLDEADRMLDMGFEPQIRKIVQELPPRRQTLMYTATWPKEVRKIAADLLVNPVQVNIGNSDELTANKSITQHVEMVHPYEKQRRLEQILRSQEPGSKVIIFCSTKKMCDQLAKHLSRGFGAAAIHGDKSQSERDYVLAQFKSGRSPILVATDVAARGLDIKDIRVVINFDFPTGVEDYVHRIGRTGRAGATGVSFTFFADQDAKYAKELVRVLEGANQKVPLELRDLAGKSFHLKGRGGRWDAGGMGGRDGGYNSFGGGRGDGRSDAFGGRGSWGPPVGQQFDRREKTFDRFGDREKFADKSARDDRYRGREVGRKFGARGRSYSRSPSRSRGKSRSRSRSRSHEKYSDDHYKRSPYRGRGSYRSRSPYRSVSPRSPYQRRSPYGHGNAAIVAKEVPPLDQPTLLEVEGKFSIGSKEHYPPDRLASSHQGRGTGRSRSPFRSVSPRSPYQSHSPYKHGKSALTSKEPQPPEQPTLPDVESGFTVSVKEHQLPHETITPSVESSIIIPANDLQQPEQLPVSATPSQMEELNCPVQPENIVVECVHDDAGDKPEVDDKIF